MTPRTLRSLLAATVALLLLVPTVALAHEERESVFPDGRGTVPTYREFSEDAPRLVVCKDDSAERIAEIGDADLRAFNEARLAECEFNHVQAAVDAVTEQFTTIYVLPGVYREEPSVTAECAKSYDGGVVTYEGVVECGEVVNLITVAGDSVSDEDMVCDNQLCNLQIEGTGAEPQDTKVLGGFDENGDWRKHNGIKIDRAGGFVLANMAFELFRENAIYVHETDGYLLDRVEANFNDLYGILTFTSDHGVISNCETHHNGDSGVYPGSPADVNQESVDELGQATYSTGTGPLERWAVEIFNCNTHHNALGFSGTAGNSVWFHDNLVHHNGAGYVTDSFVPNHPGMPQDHAFLEDNRIFANNENYYPNVQGEDAPCQDPVPANRGHQDGVVCPAFPVPVGTGVLIAGGNHNLVRTNQIYDNWRAGVMQFYVPAAIRDDVRPAAQYDTSNDNHYIDNAFGEHPDGFVQPNGVDVWWDDQGVGNCWQGNTSSSPELGGQDNPLTTVSHNSVFPVLPDCDSGGSVNQAPNPAKSGVLLPCATYDRDESPQDLQFQDPPGCNWFEDQSEPAGREEAPDDGSWGGDETVDPNEGLQAASSGEVQDVALAADEDGLGNLAATGGGSMVVLLGLGAAVAAGRMRRRDDQGAA